MTWLERAYVAGWLIAFVGSALLHLLIPEQVANASSWESAPGWQREIALWNVAAAAGSALLLVRGDRALFLRVLPVALVLFGILGANHLWSLSGAGWQVGLTTHVAGALANVVAVGVGFVVLTLHRP